MTGKVFVHIGLPKTATTTLQREVFPALSGEKIRYLGVVQPRHTSQPDDLYNRFCSSINSGHGLGETRSALIAMMESETTVVLSEEMFTVSSAGAVWRKKLKNLATLLQGLDYVLIVTVREPATALFSYYVELYDRYASSEQSFLELAKSDEGMEIFHYKKFSDVLLQHFKKDRVFIQTFEDIVSGRLDALCRLITDGRQGWLATDLKKHNEKGQANGLVYTGKEFTLSDIPRRIFRVFGMGNSAFATKLKRRLRPIVCAMDKVALAKKSVRKPSDQELIEPRSLLKLETATLERYFGIKYE